MSRILDTESSVWFTGDMEINQNLTSQTFTVELTMEQLAMLAGACLGRSVDVRNAGTESALGTADELEAMGRELATAITAPSKPSTRPGFILRSV